MSAHVYLPVVGLSSHGSPEKASVTNANIASTNVNVAAKPPCCTESVLMLKPRGENENATGYTPKIYLGPSEGS